MPYVRDSFWRGREFTSLAADARRGAGAGAARSPGARACRPLDGAAPAAVFAAVEAARVAAAAGGAVRAGHLVDARGSARTSTPRSAGTLYSVPWRLIGRPRRRPRPPRPWCSSSTTGSWSRPIRARTAGKQTDLGDYPPEKIAFHMRTPTWCRRRAAEIGPASVAVIDELLADERPVPAPRRPRRPRPGRQARPGPARGRLRARRSRPATRPTAPSRASSPPAPRPTRRPARPATAAPRRTCTAQLARCSPTSPWRTAPRRPPPADHRTTAPTRRRPCTDGLRASTERPPRRPAAGLGASHRPDAAPMDAP